MVEEEKLGEREEESSNQRRRQVAPQNLCKSTPAIIITSDNHCRYICLNSIARKNTTDFWLYRTFKSLPTQVDTGGSNSKNKCVTFSHFLLLLASKRWHWDELIFQCLKVFQELPLKILSE